MKSIQDKKIRILVVILLSVIMLFTGAALGFTDTAVATVPPDNIYFEIDAADQNQANAAYREVQNAVADEGIVLLKNEDEALPLDPTAKVTLFGNGQDRSGRGGDERISYALANAGVQLNPTVREFYRSTPGRTFTPSNGQYISGFPTYEVPVSDFTFSTDAYNGYKDAAIVVFFRIAGEGTDLPTRMAKGGNQWGGYDGWGSSTPVDGARSADDHYLQLDQTETDLLEHVCANFDKVIVLLNSGNMMELGFLDDPGHYAYHPQIKAALWVGFPQWGTQAIGRILLGEVNPSGHLVDTATRDHTKDPTFQNFSRNRQENGNRYYTGTNTNTNYYFVHYEEGIYTGYYYYETRGFTEGSNPYVTDGSASKPHMLGTKTTEWDNWYDAHVIYPLGHGLSYTTFDWELVDQSPAAGASLSKDGKITVTVRVTNSGRKAGKDVVQLYYTAPYKPGGIEKAHTVLGNFAKTTLLQPGDHEDLTITLDVSEMKSYDYGDANGNKFKGYELEGGDYEIKLCRNAHSPEFTLDYKVDGDGYRYETDTVTGNHVGNLFDDVSEYYIGETNYSCAQYMSRNNFAETFPTSGTKYRKVPSAFIDRMYMPTASVSYDEGKPWYTDEETYFAPDSSNSEIKLNYLIGRDYDDPLWDAFMDQLTRDEINYFPDHGFYETAALERINKPYTRDCDGPWGWGGDNSGGHGVSSLCGPMVAQTYNRELAFARGAAQAESGYYGNRITGWYAPGLNIHRSPFGGRNYEYYSEDARISGIIASAEVLGAKSKGMYTYAKHMFLNDQETNRDGQGLVTWANEQAMREIYAKPFEIAVKEGELQAVMSAFNRIGVTPARHSWATFTGMLRNEWGFKGMVVTDWANGGYKQETDLMIRAGNDLRLGNGDGPSNSQFANTPTHNAAVKRAAKNILFTVANSNAMNGVGVTWGEKVNALPLSYRGSSFNVTKNAEVDNVSVATATALGTTEKIEYSLVSGALPSGLSLNVDGTVSGTPTGESGLYKATFEARDVSKYFHTFASARAEFTFILAEQGESLGVEYEGGTLNAAVCGSAYSASVATARVQGNTDEVIEYTLSELSTLPEGLTLSKAGVITGTPKVPVIGHTFKVRAAIVGNNVWEPTEAEFTMGVTGRMYLNKRTVNVYIGEQFERSLDTYLADGGDASATYSVKAGTQLPSWLTLDSSTGKISGKAGAFGTHTFTVVVRADGFTSAEAVITIVVHQRSYVD